MLLGIDLNEIKDQLRSNEEKLEKIKKEKLAKLQLEKKMAKILEDRHKKGFKENY